MKKILVLTLLISQLIEIAYASNNIKLLDMEAEKWTSRVWTGQFLEQSALNDDLIFLNNTKGIDLKYLDPKSFRSFYNDSTREIMKIDQVAQSHFRKFASLCKNSYEQTQDEKKKISLYMILEEVTKKYLNQLRKAKSLSVKKDDLSTFSENSIYSSNLFKTFFDKN